MVFREVKRTLRNEDEPKEKGLEKMEFELNNEGFDSFEEESFESDDKVELQTPSLRRHGHVKRPVERYSPLDFHFSFVSSTINNEPRSIKEVVGSKECKLWKNAMVEEIEALDKNEARDLVELLDRRKHVGSKWVFKKKLNAVGKSRSTKLNW